MIQDYENELREIQSQLDVLEKRKKEITTAIKKEFGSGCDSNNFGGIQVQVIAPYYTLEFDLPKFQQEQVELYKKYLTPVFKASVTKVVLQKIKKEK